jgi:uncharacterized protein
MNLARLIIVAAVVWLAIYALRRILHYLTLPKKTPAPGAAKNMVRCAHCGLHLPESEAISDGRQYFCSQEHRRQHSDSV